MISVLIILALFHLATSSSVPTRSIYLQDAKEDSPILNLQQLTKHLNSKSNAKSLNSKDNSGLAGDQEDAETVLKNKLKSAFVETVLKNKFKNERAYNDQEDVQTVLKNKLKNAYIKHNRYTSVKNNLDVIDSILGLLKVNHNHQKQRSDNDLISSVEEEINANNVEDTRENLIPYLIAVPVPNSQSDERSSSEEMDSVEKEKSKHPSYLMYSPTQKDKPRKPISNLQLHTSHAVDKLVFSPTATFKAVEESGEEEKSKHPIYLMFSHGKADKTRNLVSNLQLLSSHAVEKPVFTSTETFSTADESVEEDKSKLPSEKEVNKDELSFIRNLAKQLCEGTDNNDCPFKQETGQSSNNGISQNQPTGQLVSLANKLTELIRNKLRKNRLNSNQDEFARPSIYLTNTQSKDLGQNPLGVRSPIILHGQHAGGPYGYGKHLTKRFLPPIVLDPNSYKN